MHALVAREALAARGAHEPVARDVLVARDVQVACALHAHEVLAAHAFVCPTRWCVHTLHIRYEIKLVFCLSQTLLQLGTVK